MKLFKSPQKILILFLSVLIVISFFMIVRLEGKAASLQSRLDEHHKSLKQNEDVLSNLKVFQRMIQVNGIYLDNKLVGFFAGNSRLDMTNDEVKLSSDDIEIGPSTNKALGYSKNEDYIYMYHNKSRILLGQIGFKSGKKQGIHIVSKDKGPRLAVVEDGILLTVPDKQGDYKISMAPSKDYIKISKDESVIKLENENIDIEAKGNIKIGPSDEKNFGYHKSEDYIYMLNKDSRVVVGPLLNKAGKFQSNGIMLISKTDGPQISLEDNRISLGVPGKDLSLQLNLDKDMVGLKQGQSTIKLEKNNLKIDVVGDINITSKNGNVNINGKKVNLNE